MPKPQYFVYNSFNMQMDWSFSKAFVQMDNCGMRFISRQFPHPQTYLWHACV